MRFCAMTLAAAILGLVGGCQAKDDRPARVPTSVTVTYQGAPVEGANVTLSPAQEAGKPAFGLTDGLGVARLSTFGQADGAIPGEYRVAIQKTRVEGSAADPNNMAPPANPSAAPASKSIDLLPAKYASPQTSGLTASVPASGKSELRFELKD